MEEGREGKGEGEKGRDGIGCVCHVIWASIVCPAAHNGERGGERKREGRGRSERGKKIKGRTDGRTNERGKGEN